MLHDIEKSITLPIIKWYDNSLQSIVKADGISAGSHGMPLRGLVSHNRPAGYPLDASFNPPAVQHTERRNPIDRRFHAAGAGSFHRRFGSLKPDIDPGSQE